MTASSAQGDNVRSLRNIADKDQIGYAITIEVSGRHGRHINAQVIIVWARQQGGSFLSEENLEAAGRAPEETVRARQQNVRQAVAIEISLHADGRVKIPDADGRTLATASEPMTRGRERRLCSIATPGGYSFRADEIQPWRRK